MFRSLADAGGATVTVTIDGETAVVPAGWTVAAAVLARGGTSRTTPVSGAQRAPYCMMGVCFDCLMEIDGVPNRQACLIAVAEGMRIRQQTGAREVEAE